MFFTHALTRRPGRDLAAGLTTANLGVPDYPAALAQFDAYVDALTGCGLTVTVLDALEGHPDAHFVEDTAVVTPEVAVVTNPGAAARKAEVETIETALASFRETVRIKSPGTVDGGDVLMMGKHVLIGLSDRTNAEGRFNWEMCLPTSATRGQPFRWQPACTSNPASTPSLTIHCSRPRPLPTIRPWPAIIKFSSFPKKPMPVTPF
ncbi:hypothetical protein [Desulfosarcina cetonica]|uniref:hypothetical protein n=1 Tax=Desulfosarcina cetonica TaxID=90730 RepID=UPI000B0ECD0D|nr:hypothetical protein [Desulfosarcina cetonica]